MHEISSLFRPPCYLLVGMTHERFQLKASNKQSKRPASHNNYLLDLFNQLKWLHGIEQNALHFKKRIVVIARAGSRGGRSGRPPAVPTPRDAKGDPLAFFLSRDEIVNIFYPLYVFIKWLNFLIFSFILFLQLHKW